MAQRPQEDNVIYANFGARTRVSSADEVTPERRDNKTRSVASRRVQDATRALADQGRITRGKQYAEAGHVVEMMIRGGSVHGRVAGSQNEPFSVSITLPYRSTDDVAEVSERLARTSNGMSKARRGELSSELLDLLIADSSEDIRFMCDCPDHVAVCKHSVALVEKLTAKLDADPTMVFQLRGLDINALEQAVLQEAENVSREAVEDGSELFWTGRELPDLPEPALAPALEDSDLDLLHKAMRKVSYTNVDQLRAVSDIEDLYEHLTR